MRLDGGSMKKPGEIEDLEINKQFTDRKEARSLFWQWYKKVDDNRDDFFVLSYYGIGGIGKSSLIDQLCREMVDKSKRYVKYDFEDAKGLDPYSILIDLKQGIRNRYGDFFRFPLFNAALLMLAKKSSVNFENDELVKRLDWGIS